MKRDEPLKIAKPMIVNQKGAKIIENKSQARRVILNIDDIRLLDNYFSKDKGLINE